MEFCRNRLARDSRQQFALRYQTPTTNHPNLDRDDGRERIFVFVKPSLDGLARL